ncbi:hypothetical protein HDV01_004415 [Terramyces sp. JEL0728]|nr:hypothetical protein HDV01_004415 [Terramyces sp. JEL0728]
MGLLIIFPVGGPLLYISCQSWRILAALDGVVLSFCANEKLSRMGFYYIPGESIFTHMKNGIFNAKSWKACFYYAVYKFIYGIILFTFTVATNPIAWLINPIQINGSQEYYHNLFSDPAGTWVQCVFQFIVAFVLFPLTFKLVRLSFILNAKIFNGLFQ